MKKTVRDAKQANLDLFREQIFATKQEVIRRNIEILFKLQGTTFSADTTKLIGEKMIEHIKNLQPPSETSKSVK